jgi:hypothetical protein
MRWDDEHDGEGETNRVRICYVTRPKNRRRGRGDGQASGLELRECSGITTYTRLRT